MSTTNVIWHEHLEEIFGSVQKLLVNDHLKDCTILCEGQSFTAHRLLLSASSRYFKSLFARTPSNPTVVLKDVSPYIFQIILDFVYHGQAALKTEDLPAIINAALHLEFTSVALMAKRMEIEIEHPTSQQESALPQDLTYNPRCLGSSIGHQPPAATNTEPAEADLITAGAALVNQQPSTVVGASSAAPYLKHESADCSDNSDSSVETMVRLGQRRINPLVRIPKQYMAPAKRKLPEVSPGEKWFQGRLEFMLSQRGKPLLVHDGHSFGIQYIRKDKKYWQCNLSRKYNCKARVTTTDTGDIIVTNNEHCHTEIRQHLRKDYKTMKLAASLAANRGTFGLSTLPMFSPRTLVLPSLHGEFVECSNSESGEQLHASPAALHPAGEQSPGQSELGSLNLSMDSWVIKRESSNCSE
ncbi:protein bric-a-brac 2-like [Anopheles nili]|uniref:protein bric-a-brac 2-like n=1 Tax=Anopheles nili TaxID=185578 RepID=UPI00237A75DB|nr:protein bric-a-brac 2-like [Anopheles nili]